MISLLVFFFNFVDQAPAPPLSEAQLNYEFHCKSCHEPGQPGVPDISVLRKWSTEAIVRALESGKMSAMGSTLTRDERRAIAELITRDQAPSREN